MYIATIPNRNSPPAILLREGYREDGKVKSRTLANLSKWNPQRIEALRRALRGDFDGVLHDADPTSDRIFGVLFVLKELADRLQITKALGNSRMGRLALFLVLARVADQGSRLSAVRWAQDHCVPEILGLDRIEEKELYQALDWLAQHQDKIEKKLFRAYARKKGAPNILVLYDVTSAYLEGDCNELGAFGFCRDKKKGKKQIVIGLLTSADGEPLSVKVFKGNTGDPQTVGAQIDTLKRRFGVEDVVFVGDRGMVKAKGKEALERDGFKYITALTNPQVRKLLKQGIIQLDLFDETVCEVQNGPVRLVLRKNERVRYRAQERREDKLVQLRSLIEKRNRFVMQSKRADAEAGVRKLTRWADRHKISTFVALTLDDRRIVMSVDEEAKSRAGLLDGCYVLETDVSKELMQAGIVDERYRSLHLVERNFRTLKTGLLEVRPVFVRKAERTSGHALVAMLALKIVREAEGLLAGAFAPTEKGQGASLLKDSLGTLSRFCFNLWRIKDHEFLRLPQPNDRQRAIFDALGIRPPSKTTYQVLADKK